MREKSNIQRELNPTTFRDSAGNAGWIAIAPSQLAPSDDGLIGMQEAHHTRYVEPVTHIFAAPAEATSDKRMSPQSSSQFSLPQTSCD